MKKKDKQRFLKLEETLKSTQAKLFDLIEFFERTDVLDRADHNAQDWRHQLIILRHEEEKEQEIRQSKNVLENEGYIIVRNQNELDAAKLKVWVKNEGKTENKSRNIKRLR